jgi:hypothetical protein
MKAIEKSRRIAMDASREVSVALFSPNLLVRWAVLFILDAPCATLICGVDGAIVKGRAVEITCSQVEKEGRCAPGRQSGQKDSASQALFREWKGFSHPRPRVLILEGKRFAAPLSADGIMVSMLLSAIYSAPRAPILLCFSLLWHRECW